MAAGEGWRSRLGLLFDKLNQKYTKPSDSKDPKSVLEVKDGSLYVWSEELKSVLLLNLYQLERQDDTGFQCLVPTSPPSYSIHAVICNPTCMRLALVGRHGVNVLEFPRSSRVSEESISTDSLFSGRYLCSSVEIAERFFMCNPNCNVLQAKWHPGSDTSTHLMLLLSNNYVRVYDCRAPASPEQVYQLGQVPVFRLSPSAASPYIGSALGETAVDFDFGRPTPARDQFDPKTLSRLMDPDDLVWPVFILRGNGDVFTTWATNPKYSGLKFEVSGPLTMHPPAEDNYGVDACSIVCLSSVPTVLAIVTCPGILYHCIILQNTEIGDSLNLSRASDIQWEGSKTSHTLCAPDLALFVYESVELQLILAPSRDTGEDDEEQPEVTQPINLHKDPTTNLRYHCSHSAGVHTVALPLISQLHNLLDENTGFSGTYSADALSTIENQTCIVEHLICTKPLPNSCSVPVVGLGVVHGLDLGGATLLCLTSPFEITSLPLVPTYLDSLPRLLSTSKEDSSSNLEKPLTAKEPFSQLIRGILQRNSSNPIIKSDNNTNVSPEDCFQLLNRSTQVLREEYIEKMDLAREKIEERVYTLQELRVQQLAELSELRKSKDQLTSNARDLAEKYEALQDRQDSILVRVQTVSRNLLRQMPSLSNAEQNMRQELLSLEENLKYRKNAIEQIRTKQMYQDQLIERHNTNMKQKTPVTPSDAQMRQIKEILAKQSEELKHLTSKLNEIHKVIGPQLFS